MPRVLNSAPKADVSRPSPRRRAIDLDILINSPCFFDIGRRGRPPIH